MIRDKEKGAVIWLTGISGAGKTTLGLRVKDTLQKKGVPLDMLDGDIVRNFFENDLGYTRQERIQNVRRIAFTAKCLADHGINVIVANIAPYFEVREFIREKTPCYLQIFVKVSTEEAIHRDVKGHYKKFKAGEMTDLVGVDDDYDIPRNPDLVVDTDIETVEQSTANILNLLKENNIYS